MTGPSTRRDLPGDGRRGPGLRRRCLGPGSARPAADGPAPRRSPRWPRPTTTSRTPTTSSAGSSTASRSTTARACTSPTSTSPASSSSRPPPTDLGRAKARRHGVRLSPTIADALTLGTGKLAVDAVLLIAEHGDYPFNAKLQKLYPRGRFFREVLDVFQTSGRSVPVFIDKHLSYDRPRPGGWSTSARTAKVPLMAGSSLPGDLAAARRSRSRSAWRGRRPWSPRGASSRSSGSTPWRRSSAWSSVATGRGSRRGSRRSPASKATPSGRRSTRARSRRPARRRPRAEPHPQPRRHAAERPRLRPAPGPPDVPGRARSPSSSNTPTASGARP